MSTRHYRFLVNPISGVRSKAALPRLIESVMSSYVHAYSVAPSRADGDYRDLRSEIDHGLVTDVVIAGGDGTVGSVLQGLRGADVTFSVIPLGSGNGLALSAGLPRDPAAAIRVALHGEARPTDALTVNGRFAALLCGLGFDAQVAHAFAEDPRRGLATYLRQGVRHFFSAPVFPFTVEAEGRSWETEAYFISVANANQYGNNFTIAPRASLSDGLLDAVILPRQNRLSLLLAALRQVLGANAPIRVDEVEGKSVVYFQTDRIRIGNAGGALLHIDGDPAPGVEEVEISVLKGAYRLRYPS